MRDLFSFDPEQAEKAENALKRLEDNLIHTLDAHRLGIILFDVSGDLIACNQQWERLFAIRYEAFADYNILEDETIRKKPIWDSVKDAFSGKAGIMEENHFSPEELGKPGRGRWTEGHILPIFETTKSDNFLGTAIFLQDITDKKMTLSEIAELRKILTDVKTQQEELSRRVSDLLADAQRKLMPQLPGHIKSLRDRHNPTAIPRREREVFEKLAAGYTVKETAHQLGLGIKSVYTYRSRLLKRLGISGDVGLALAWRELHEGPGELVLNTERNTDFVE